ncbi:class I SAM-dependent methyltransferase [Kribbella sp. NPDC026611]|uniref:SAM-dependent methyltransferase n=1 Tax=Kribbella sp. NPDC026611 TaxID=3154911 RepID=UPI003407A662
MTTPDPTAPEPPAAGTPAPDPLSRFALSSAARSTVQSWATGASLLALTSALHANGWFKYLSDPRTLDELTQYSGLSPERVYDVVAVLESQGVVQQDSAIQLTAEFAALTAEDAWVGLDELVDYSAVTVGLAAAAAEPAVAATSETDALVTARASGGRSTHITRALFDQLFLPHLAELVHVVRTDRWLDVGCGVAGSTLTLATLYPELRGVAIELLPTVAAETQRRAEALGVADRLEIRCMDARKLDEHEAFGGAFWAQPFFPEETRATTLEVILRALRPGGLLFLQEREPEPTEEGRPAYNLGRLLAHTRGLPYGRTAEELTAEAVAAGFEAVWIAPTDFGRIVIVRRPL